MDYKEKYEQALERARRLEENSNGMILKKWLLNVFPELEESEDERIKNDIIALLHFALEDGSTVAPGRNTTKEEALAWLENQEEKSVDKDKPKESEDEIIPDKNDVRDVEQNLVGNDEKIRKDIVDFINRVYERQALIIIDEEKDNWIAWLEKQGMSYTKKDVDIAYIKGINDAKNEIEKQYEATYQIRKRLQTY